jgi:hypothetical protein
MQQEQDQDTHLVDMVEKVNRITNRATNFVAHLRELRLNTTI